MQATGLDQPVLRRNLYLFVVTCMQKLSKHEYRKRQKNSYMLSESIKKILCLEYITFPVGLCFMSQGAKL